MKNNILIIFFILSSIGICLGQSLGVEYVSPKNITLRFDHIEVTDMNGNQIVKKSNTMIVYYPSGFTIVSDEEKIYYRCWYYGWVYYIWWTFSYKE